MTKKTLFSLLAVGVLFTAAVAAQAQQAVNLRANIPFAFAVGDKTMPSGHYSVSEPATGILRICGEDCVGVATMNNGYTNDSNTSSKLIFVHRGGDYVLSQVWMHEQGRKVPVGRRQQTRLASAQGPESIEIVSLR